MHIAWVCRIFFEALGKIVILGCGYAGRALTRRLIERGDPVRATTTTEANLGALAALGAEPIHLRIEEPATFFRAFEDAEVIVHLAPPIKNTDTRALVNRIKAAANSGLRAYVYGSTTGVFGAGPDREAWIDESSEPGELTERAKDRLEYERALADAGFPLRVLRIAGIYGPGRTLREPIDRGALVLFQGGPMTSRIHVADLARMLEGATGPDWPRMMIACDELPAPTTDVARYTCGLLNRSAPEPISIEDARRVLSPLAMEMRLGGHRCRSLFRERLIGKLDYPTYKEGVRAALIAEGALPA